eukprot:s5_g32.t1
MPQEPKLAGASWADGKWYDVPMAFNLALPMCEAPTPHEEDLISTAFGGSCYKLIFHPSDFDIAEERWPPLLLDRASTTPQLHSLELDRSLGLPQLGLGNGWSMVAIMNFNMEEYRRKEPLAWASGRWYDVDGALNLPKAICKKRKVAGICDTGWKNHEESCYFKLTWHYNFDTSTLRCEDMGAELVSIGTLSEQIFVQHLCGQQMCWLGLQEHPQTEAWFWIDGTPLAYQNWQVGEPNNGQGDENRAVMNMNPGIAWHTMNLNFEENIMHQEVREDHIAVALACGFLLLFVILLGRGAILHNRRRGFGGFAPSMVEHDEDLLEQLDQRNQII